MLEVGARVAQQGPRQAQVFGAGEQVALEEHVARRRDHRVLEQVVVAVPEAVHTDATDEVELGGAVGELHERAPSGAGGEHREHQRPTAKALDVANRLFVGLVVELGAVVLVAHRFDQGARGLAHRLRRDGRVQGEGRAGLGHTRFLGLARRLSWGRERCDPESFRLARADRHPVSAGPPSGFS